VSIGFIIHTPTSEVMHITASNFPPPGEVWNGLTMGTVYSSFTLTLTTSGTGSGTIQASPGGPYTYGDTVTIWANASVGSTFTGFTGSLSGTTTPQNLTFDGNETVDAAFTLNGPYTLSLTTSGSGAGVIEANSTGPFYYGDTVMIWANASVGSTFTGFTGSLSGTATPQNLTFDGNETVDAAFTLNDIYSITYYKRIWMPGLLRQTPLGRITMGIYCDDLGECE
jgi:hypothetical protein